MLDTIKKITRKAAVLTVLLGGLVVLGGAATTFRAADDCYRRIDQQEYKLQRDIDRHGFHSRQADHDRQKLAELRERCGRYHGYDHR
jgi:hypothetical protein